MTGPALSRFAPESSAGGAATSPGKGGWLAAGHVAVIVCIGVSAVFWEAPPIARLGEPVPWSDPVRLVPVGFAAALGALCLVGHLHALWSLRRLAGSARSGPDTRVAAVRAAQRTLMIFFIGALWAPVVLSTATDQGRRWLPAMVVGLLVASLLLCHARSSQLNDGIPDRGRQAQHAGSVGIVRRQPDGMAFMFGLALLFGAGLIVATFVQESPEGGPLVVVHVLAALAVVVQVVWLQCAAVVYRRALGDGDVDLAALGHVRALFHGAGVVAAVAGALLVVGFLAAKEAGPLDYPRVALPLLVLCGQVLVHLVLVLVGSGTEVRPSRRGRWG